MTVPTRGLRLALTLLAMVSVMAVTTGSALATTEWQIGGNSMKSLGASEVGATGKLGETFRLAIPWYASEIACASIAAEGAKIIQGGTSFLTLKMSSCTLSGPPFVAETCKLTQPIAFNMAGVTVSHGGGFYELYKPATEGKPFTTIEFQEGTECPLPLKNSISGTVVAAFETGEREEQPLTFSSSTESLFGSDALFFGAHPATLKGQEKLKLNSPYAGKIWGPGPPPSEVRVLGKAELATNALFTAEQVGQGTLLLPSINAELVCQKFDVLSGKVTSGQSGAGLAEILYLECEYWATKGASQELSSKLPCEILEEGTLAKGAIVIKAKFQVIFHNEDTYVLAEPDGGVFGSIKITSPSECPLSQLTELKGTIVFKVALGDLSLKQSEETDITVESTRAINELFSSKDKFLSGVNAMYIDGKALLKLVGAHVGCKWGLI